MKKKIEEFYKAHKSAVWAGAGLVLAGTALAIAVANGGDEIDAPEVIDVTPKDIPETDFGRDCIARFFVQETGEEIGSILCTELYAKEMIDISCAE